MGNITNQKNRVTIYEVAKASNKSLATVSRVINNKSNVTEKTRKIVNDAIIRLNYRPSALAQGLAKNKSTNIGIVIPSTNYSYINNMLSGMVDIAKIYGYLTILFITKPVEEDNNKMTEKLITSHVDGAVIYDDKLTTQSLQMLEECKIPLVVIGREIESDLISSIVLNYKEPLFEIVDSLTEDCNEINYLSYDNQGTILSDLLKETENYCHEKNIKLNVMNFEDNYTMLYNHMLEYFKTYKKGKFICPRDSFALAVMNAATDSNINVPQDVEVVSIIGTKYSYISRPTLSTLSIDMFEVGSIAMRMLTKTLDNSLKQRVYRLKAQYIKRGSTKK